MCNIDYDKIEYKNLEDYFYKDGNIVKIVSYYSLDKNIYSERYYNKEGYLHREGDKPAQIWYDRKGNVLEEYYFIEGNLYKINEFKKGRINWQHIYTVYRNNIKILIKYSNKMRNFLTTEDKIKIIEYKIKNGL